MASTWSWSEIWQAYLWPLLVMVFQSVVLLVALLVIVAFLLLMDRKVWAAVQMRRGPNVVGPFGPAVRDFYLTNPIARASAIMAELSALKRNMLRGSTGTHG